ncbi:MAG: hypothetical protein ACLRFP_01490, partial [Alphaproteobacteria bacterium]
ELRGACSYILGFAPRHKINKNTAVDAVFLFIAVELRIQTTKFFVGFESYPRPSHKCAVTAGHS